MTPDALVVVTMTLGAAWLVDRAVGVRLHPRLRSGIWLLVLCRILVPGEAIAVVAPEDLRWAIPADAAGSVGAWSAGWVTPERVVLIEVGWLTGALALLTIWWLRTRRLVRRLEPATADDRDAVERVTRRALDSLGLRLPALGIDRGTRTPYVTGLRTPRLVLPADWPSWPPTMLEHAIGHELLHLRRRDLWVEGLWLAATALYWFHPLIFVARRRAHVVRELACDADAVRLFGRPYRQTMREVIGRHVFGAPRAVAGRHAWGPAVARLQSLDRWAGPLSRRGRLGALAALTGLAVALAALQAPPASAGVAPTLAELVDPATRQARGLGSLHLRYALAAEAAARR